MSTLSSLLAGLALNAGSVELSSVRIAGPLIVAPAGKAGPAPAGQAAAAAWSLGPLATTEGAIRAEIVDAHLLFDADVTVPIRQGNIHFNDATVEHVGPDSRMGVSRMGIYVDAPNGRSYLYQFPSAPVSGVEYERRGALLGTLVSDRGSLQLQAFAEALLGQLRGGHGLGVTEQARMLFDRTAIKGEVRLGDGKFIAPGVQADLAGRAAGHNTVRLHAQAVGRGITAEIDSLLVRNAVLEAGGIDLRCDEITGSFTLRLVVEGDQLRLAAEVSKLKVFRLVQRSSLTRQISAPGAVPGSQRRRFLTAAFGAGLPLQKSTICRIASAWLAATCFFAALATCPRALPVAWLAAVSHMLMNGFFFSQGLLMR